MQTTLRIDEETYREAKAEAARLGITMTSFIEQALQTQIRQRQQTPAYRDQEIAERNQMMEELLKRTAHFRIGVKPTRDEMNER